MSAIAAGADFTEAGPLGLVTTPMGMSQMFHAVLRSQVWSTCPITHLGFIPWVATFFCCQLLYFVLQKHGVYMIDIHL